ncbi:unnamed protein product [Adineta ricciae]|uniref:G-protein coupled receptors family 1 profile domain-containing protein n=1 Tax=Adineta ricciae TaxID=249248 RepID=A0A813SHY9_ADIRI|nr:unnamed protein product [Adineta ricciae]CAF1271363.1 unnamed protein product [Adineta ricciae]
MSTPVDLNDNYNSAAIAHALLSNISQVNLNRPYYTATRRSNWSILYIPGSPPLSLTSTTTPSPSNHDYYPFWILLIIAIFGSVTSVLTVLGNILVMLAFFLDRQIRQPTNYFILSLSVSDFLIGLLSMPLLTTYIYAHDWPFNAIICDIWLSLDYTVCLTSIYTVLFITIDRFCSVKMPAKYRKWRTKRKINLMITVTWAVPTLIFFTATMFYPRLKGVFNLQNGVCDVQWNKSHVFNLCLTIGYFWTTLLVMIVLYIFIYDVASKLEKKSQENARKMSSLVGMAGSAMTQIGVGIGVNKSPTKSIPHRTNRKADSIKSINNDSQNEAPRKKIQTQLSMNSSEQRGTNDGGDDENSNSFESHSDLEANNMHDKKTNLFDDHLPRHNRRGLNVNWSNNSSAAVHVKTTATTTMGKSPNHDIQIIQKSPSNMKSFAHSLYRSPMRITGISATGKMKSKQSNSPSVLTTNLTPIPSESELSPARMHPPPQPRPETLAIMSDELFHERLKARQSPLLFTSEPSQQVALNTDEPSTTNFSSRSSLVNKPDLVEDVPPIEEVLPKENRIEINASSQPPSPLTSLPSDTLVEPMTVNHIEDSSDESWRLLNSNSSLDIPYIDETDFEDLGYILHRRCVPISNSNEPVHEETIVYKSPLYMKHKLRSKSSTSSFSKNCQSDAIEIHGNIQDAHQAIYQSPVFDSVELITYPCTNSNPSLEKFPIRHCSLRHVPREMLLKRTKQCASLPLSSNDIQTATAVAGTTTSSIIFVSKAKRPLSQTSTPLTTSPSPHRNANIERALIEFYQCSEINDIDDSLTNSGSDILSNYKETSQDTSSLLRLNEQYSSAFIDDDYSYQCDNNLMKMMILNKTSIDTTSDEQTLTNSISLNTYSQDCSIDKIFQAPSLNEELSRTSWISSPSSSSSSQDRQIPQHFLAAIDKKRNTSSDSDAITTTTTTLTTSTVYGGMDKRQISEELQTSEICPILKKHHSETYLPDNELAHIHNRNASKVTFESFVTQTSISSSPKTRDQSVMTQFDLKEPPVTPEPIQNEVEPKNVLTPTTNEVTAVCITSSGSTKSSVRELLQGQKSTTRRKSKSQNRARKALRTITFILGAFVVCWTPWHIYSAVHSLCESCKNNWIFSNPMFHCVYFLCYLNSPINPFCYALANQQFKKTFTRILKLDLRRL